MERMTKAERAQAVEVIKLEDVQEASNTLALSLQRLG